MERPARRKDKPAPLDASTSRKMASVRLRGTTAEIEVRRALRSLSVGYRVNVRKLPGSPDLANQGRCWAIFVHGCFWHQHPGCPRATVPKHNAEYWAEKFRSNRMRDAQKRKTLEDAGFKVLTIWECETGDPVLLKARLSEFLEPTSGSRDRKASF